MERVMGIEPTLPAWEAGILPLNYTRKRLFAWYYTTATWEKQVYLSPEIHSLQ